MVFARETIVKLLSGMTNFSYKTSISRENFKKLSKTLLNFSDFLTQVSISGSSDADMLSYGSLRNRPKIVIFPKQAIELTK